MWRWSTTRREDVKDLIRKASTCQSPRCRNRSLIRRRPTVNFKMSLATTRIGTVSMPMKTAIPIHHDPIHKGRRRWVLLFLIVHLLLHLLLLLLRHRRDIHLLLHRWWCNNIIVNRINMWSNRSTTSLNHNSPSLHLIRFSSLLGPHLVEVEGADICPLARGMHLQHSLPPLLQRQHQHHRLLQLLQNPFRCHLQRPSLLCVHCSLLVRSSKWRVDWIRIIFLLLLFQLLLLLLPLPKIRSKKMVATLLLYHCLFLLLFLLCVPFSRSSRSSSHRPKQRRRRLRTWNVDFFRQDPFSISTVRRDINSSGTTNSNLHRLCATRYSVPIGPKPLLLLLRSNLLNQSIHSFSITKRYSIYYSSEL